MTTTAARPTRSVEQARRAGWGRVLERVLASVLGLALALLAGEGIIRAVFDVAPPITRHHPLLGKTYEPGFDGPLFDREAGREVHVRFDREGFRGPDRPYVKSAGTRRVALIGDSFVAALAVEEHETAAGVLQRRLCEAHPGTSFEVQNFGVGGAGTGQELVLWREVASKYQPDVVLCAYFVGNDFADNSRELSSSYKIYFELGRDGRELVQQPLSAHQRFKKEFLERHSRLYVWQKNAIGALRRREEDRRDLANADLIFDAEPDARLERVWRLNERLIEAFRDETQARGARFALVLLPAPQQVYGDVWETEIAERVATRAARFDPDYPERRLAAACREKRIACLSLTPAFRAAATHRLAHATAPEDLLFLDRGRGHFSVRANALVGDTIARFLEDSAAEITGGASR